ncbi:MAG: MerR family transcriptional regulator [Syntrophomonadaceae bacterium]|nr:MerR family transcriptional regulator [Syntrophomonadaceae bacterium]
MAEVYYKIGEVAEMLMIEQYTLRYLEHSLRLKIKRNERGERQYSESDLETLRLVMKLKKEKGLNATAIRMALDNLETKTEEAPVLPVERPALPDIIRIGQTTERIAEQNQKLMEQNERLQASLKTLEQKINALEQRREERLDELIRLVKSDQEERQKSWLSALKRK